MSRPLVLAATGLLVAAWAALLLPRWKPLEDDPDCPDELEPVDDCEVEAA